MCVEPTRLDSSRVCLLNTVNIQYAFKCKFLFYISNYPLKKIIRRPKYCSVCFPFLYCYYVFPVNGLDENM